MAGYKFPLQGQHLGRQAQGSHLQQRRDEVPFHGMKLRNIAHSLSVNKISNSVKRLND